MSPKITTESLASALAARADEGRPVRIGLVGAGEMGTDIVTQVSLMRGLEIGVIADVREKNGFEAVKIAGLPADRAVAADTAKAADKTIAADKIAIAESFQIACMAEQVDVIIEATGNPNVGAEVALLAMEHGKHVVMMNVETDVTAGAYLRHMADKAGVVYTLGAGDEPTAAMELVNFVRSLGYPIVAAGKGKNNPFRREAVPSEYEEEARRRNMNPRMLVEFVDGSKTMIEMTALANATGLVPDIAGMHGPAAPLSELHKVLCPVADGGMLSRKGVVDFTVAKGVAPGVFVVAEMAHPRLRERMHDLQMGPGPYYTFFRPYHLTSLEVPLSAAAAVLWRQAHMRPLPVPVAEVGAVAKKDLKPGDVLDAIGEYCYRGMALAVPEAQRLAALPLGLAQRAVVTQPIKAGEYLTYRNCKADPKLAIVRLREQQDAHIAKNAAA
ncbi:MAG: homoserine dehydrogenase [Rhodospirillales bacterium]|nr:homoserine dehydrogenase [Rhodospirillales bacterium]